MRLAPLQIALAAAAILCGGEAHAARRDLAGMSWDFTASAEQGARLALGVPDTDDVFAIFSCSPRSGAVHLMVVARQGDGAAVELRSGKARARYPGAGEADEETLGAYDIQLDLNADDPVLRRVADTGELTIVTGRRSAATPNVFAPFHDFLDVCRSRP